MEMRGQNKEIETSTITTLGYNLPNRDSPSSSSKLSSPTPLTERPGTNHNHNQQHPPPLQAHHTFIEPPHHNLYPPPPPPPPPPPLAHRPASDPDLITPVSLTSNTPRTTPPPTITTIAAIGTTTTTTAATTTTTTTTTTITSAPLIRYRECLRNHAASMGSHVVDGCGEFMASGDASTPESLRCAACDCHRNFHRKEVQGELQSQQPLPPPPPQPQHVPSYHNYYTNKHNGHLHFPTPSRLITTPSLVPPVMMAFGGPAESSSEDLNMFQSHSGAQLSVQAPLSSKKRFRTKFSQQQKERMMEFAEKIDWKIQKQNEQEVQQFCSQVGVKRQVFKVWMHNNKQASKKHEEQQM